MGILSTLSLCLLAVTTFAQPGPVAPLQKVVQPPMSMAVSDLEAYLPIAGHNGYQDWADTDILQFCKDIAQDWGLDPRDVATFSVTYDDCDRGPWIICRHKDAGISKERIADVGAT